MRRDKGLMLIRKTNSTKDCQQQTPYQSETNALHLIYISNYCTIISSYQTDIHTYIHILDIYIHSKGNIHTYYIEIYIYQGKEDATD